MASQVLSGASNPSYTNNTGQNVRVVINYMQSSGTITLNWAGVSVSAPMAAIGRNLAIAEYISESAPKNTFFSSTTNRGSLNDTTSQSESQAAFSGYGFASNNNALLNKSVITVNYAGPRQPGQGSLTSGSGALPTELILAPGQTFSAVCGVHNIVVIPELG